MFQLLRRVSGSFLPRPDRPWREDATSHAPTIGRKRRYSIMAHDEADSPSMAKKAKNEPVDAECDSVSEGSSPGTTPVEGQGVKEVTEGVEEVDLEDKDRVEDVSLSIPPEGVPLPDSPSPSPEAEADNLDTGAKIGDKDSDASSVVEGQVEEDTEDNGGGPEAAETDDTGGITPAQDNLATTVIPTEALEAEA